MTMQGLASRVVGFRGLEGLGGVKVGCMEGGRDKSSEARSSS